MPSPGPLPGSSCGRPRNRRRTGEERGVISSTIGTGHPCRSASHRGSGERLLDCAGWPDIFGTHYRQRGVQQTIGAMVDL